MANSHLQEIEDNGSEKKNCKRRSDDRGVLETAFADEKKYWVGELQRDHNCINDEPIQNSISVVHRAPDGVIVPRCNAKCFTQIMAKREPLRRRRDVGHIRSSGDPGALMGNTVVLSAHFAFHLARSLAPIRRSV